MTGDEIRAARKLLNWSGPTLAGVARVSVGMIWNAEHDQYVPALKLQAIQRALEAAGLEFTNGGQPGVRLNPPGATGTG